MRTIQSGLDNCRKYCSLLIEELQIRINYQKFLLLEHFRGTIVHYGSSMFVYYFIYFIFFITAYIHIEVYMSRGDFRRFFFVLTSVSALTDIMILQGGPP